MKGRKPLPTKLKVIQGTAQNCRLNGDEPVLHSSEMVAPDDLSAAAKKEWCRLYDILHGSGIVTDVDLSALKIYCETYAVWEDAQKRLQKTGLLIKAPNGGLVRNPYLKIANDAQDRMLKILIEFGMTPSSRSRVRAAKIDDEDENPFAKFKRN